MSGKSVYDARDCPKCSFQINQKMTSSPWPLLLCSRCLTMETKREKQEDRIERRQKHGDSLSAAELLRVQAEPVSVKLENPILRASDLPPDELRLAQANPSVEMLEAVSAPFGHALLACDGAASLQGTQRSSVPQAAIKQDDSTYHNDEASLLGAAAGRCGNKTLFVGGLHRDIKKATLSLLFKDFTHDIPFIRHNWKLKGKGKAVCWAMVEVSTPTEAARAVRDLDGTQWLDCKVSVRLHTPRKSTQSFEPSAYEESGRTLYIRGIESDVTEDMLLSFMDDFQARIHVLKNDYAIVEVSSNAEALRAIDVLDKQRILKREIRVQLNRNKRHEPVPRIHFKPQRVLIPVYRFEHDHEQKVVSTLDQDDVKPEEPRQVEYYASRASLDRGVAIPSEHISIDHLNRDVKYRGDADMYDVGFMSQVSDVPSTGEITREIDIVTRGTSDWVPGVLNEILKMEMASRPSSWLDVALSVQRELQHQLMTDITEGDPSEGTPISVPLLELLGHRLYELRQL